MSVTGYGQGTKSYLLSNGTFTTNFVEWHEDDMAQFRKTKGLTSQALLPPATEQKPAPNPTIARVPEYSLDIDSLLKKSFQEQSDPKLLATIEKLRKFAEARKKTNHMAMNFYSHLNGLYKPLTEQDLGGEWSDSSQYRTCCQNYVKKHLSAEGYAFTTENVITFVERYMAEFPNLHLER